MPQPSSLEQIVLATYSLLVKQIEDIDDAMQKEFGIPSTFDIARYGPADYAYAENRLHKPGEEIPCQICISEALAQAQTEMMAQAQGQPQGAQTPSP